MHVCLPIDRTHSFVPHTVFHWFTYPYVRYIVSCILIARQWKPIRLWSRADESRCLNSNTVHRIGKHRTIVTNGEKFARTCNTNEVFGDRNNWCKRPDWCMWLVCYYWQEGRESNCNSCYSMFREFKEKCEWNIQFHLSCYRLFISFDSVNGLWFKVLRFISFSWGKFPPHDRLEWISKTGPIPKRKEDEEK